MANMGAEPGVGAWLVTWRCNVAPSQFFGHFMHGKYSTVWLAPHQQVGEPHGLHHYIRSVSLGSCCVI